MPKSNQLCGCNCGEYTNFVRFSSTRDGVKKGEPHRFIAGHYAKLRVGSLSSNWQGGQIKNEAGYLCILQPEHPRVNGLGYVRIHILVAEKAVGHFLAPPIVIHHLDENPANNANNNLVICPDSAYHNLLHQRLRAKKECGNPNWRKCNYCKKYDSPSNMWMNTSNAHHKECMKNYQRERNRLNAALR